MKILVTGGNGLVGRACQRCAIENNIDISIVSRKESLFASTAFYSSLKEIPSNQINFDLVIHCAAATPNNTNFDSIPEISGNIDKDLCDFLKKRTVKHVVYLSTMAVYGVIKVDVLSEKSKINNPNLYGYSKYLGEKVVKQTCLKNNILISIIRLPGVVGKNMPLIFFRRLYESILYGREVNIRSRNSLFNNAILDKDVFLTSINLLEKQKDKFILLNHHSLNTITLGKLIDDFSETIGKFCIYKESLECNPPFLITNTINEDLLVKSDIKKMIMEFHTSYKK